MRIGLFTDTYLPDINGVVSSIVTLQKELEKNGHDVFVITNHKGLYSKWEDNVLRLPGLELKWLYGYKLSTPFHISIKEEIRRLHLDIIHVHTEFGVGMFGRIVAKYLNIPVVSTYHTMYEDYTHYVIPFEINEVDKVSKRIVGSVSRVLADNVQGVISPSEKTKETLLKYGVKTPIYIIPTGLNLDKFNIQNIDFKRVKEIRQQYGILDDEKLVIYVGRIAQEKSIDIPIDGFNYVKNQKIKLMIVGGGPQLDELKTLVRKYHLEQRVIFTDKVANSDVPCYYASADAFVSASITETQGMTFIEALSCALPVFARPDDVLNDLVIENRTGYLFNNPAEFAEKVDQYFMLDKDQQEQIKNNAQQQVKKYDADIFYSKVLSVYYQAIDDFQDAYEVTKIKMVDDYVRISVMNDKEDEPKKILISLDDYFFYKIRVHTKLDRYIIAEFEEREKYIDAYRGAIRKLRIRDYTRKEMYSYLTYKQGLDEEHAIKLIEELQLKGYIDDNRYLEEKMEKFKYTFIGKDKFRKNLLEKGIEREAIERVLMDYDDEVEREKAIRVAEKIKATIKGSSVRMKQQKIIRKLVSLGFENELARSIAQRLGFEDEDSKEALEKAIQKGIRLYRNKYKDIQLREHVYIYCMRQGFRSEEIRSLLDTIDWEEFNEG